MSGPSEKAIEAAYAASPDPQDWDPATTLRAAHDPALGLDRSVCLRDVVEYLRVELREPLLAGEFEREFGGGA